MSENQLRKGIQDHHNSINMKSEGRENKFISFPLLKESSNFSDILAISQRFSWKNNLLDSLTNPTRKHSLPTKDTTETLRIDTEMKSVKRPPRVLSKSEANTQVYLKSSRCHSQKPTGINSQLSLAFPIHNNKNFVNLHSQGFKEKENVDLFKHYLRMYMKNHHKIKAIKKEKRENNSSYDSFEELESDNLILDCQGNEKRVSIIDTFLEDQIDYSSSASLITSDTGGGFQQVKNTSYLSQFKKSQNLIKKRLNLQDFIVQKSLNDLQYYTNVLSEYETKILSRHKKKYSQQSLLDELKEKAQTKLNFVAIQSESSRIPCGEGEEDDQLNLEDFFIKQILLKIEKHGLKIMSQDDYHEFKRIVASRKDKLTQIKNELLIKNKLYEIQQRVKDNISIQKKNSEDTQQVIYSQLKQNDYFKLTPLFKNQIQNQSTLTPIIQLQSKNISSNFKVNNSSTLLDKLGQIKLSPMQKKNLKYQGYAKHPDEIINNEESDLTETAEERKQDAELTNAFLKEEYYKFQEKMSFLFIGQSFISQTQESDQTKNSFPMTLGQNDIIVDNQQPNLNINSLKQPPLQEILQNKLKERMNAQYEREHSYIEKVKNPHNLQNSIQTSAGDSSSIASSNEEDPLDLLIDMAEQKGMSKQLAELLEGNDQDQSLQQLLYSIAGSITEDDIKQRTYVKYKLYLNKNKDKRKPHSQFRSSDVLNDLSSIRPTSRDFKAGSNDNFYSDYHKDPGSFTRILQSPASVTSYTSQLNKDTVYFPSLNLENLGPTQSARFFAEDSSNREAAWKIKMSEILQAKEGQQKFKQPGDISERNDFINGDSSKLLHYSQSQQQQFANNSSQFAEQKKGVPNNMTKDEYVQYKLLQQITKKNKLKMNSDLQQTSQPSKKILHQTSSELMGAMAIKQKERSSPKLNRGKGYDTMREKNSVVISQTNSIGSRISKKFMETQQIKVDAQKIKIESENKSIDAEVQSIQNILTSHKKHNNKLFKKVQGEDQNGQTSHRSSQSQFNDFNSKIDEENLEQISQDNPDKIQEKEHDPLAQVNTDESKPKKKVKKARVLKIEAINQLMNLQKRALNPNAQENSLQDGKQADETQKVNDSEISSDKEDDEDEEDSDSNINSSSNESDSKSGSGSSSENDNSSNEENDSEIDSQKVDDNDEEKNYTEEKENLTEQSQQNSSTTMKEQPKVRFIKQSVLIQKENKTLLKSEPDIEDVQQEEEEEIEKEEIHEEEREVIDAQGNKRIEKVSVSVKVKVKVKIPIKGKEASTKKKVAQKKQGGSKTTGKKKSSPSKQKGEIDQDQREEEIVYEKVEVEEVVVDEKGEEVKVIKIIEVPKQQPVVTIKKKKKEQVKVEEEQEEGVEQSNVENGQTLKVPKTKTKEKKPSKKEKEVVEEKPKKKKKQQSNEKEEVIKIENQSEDDEYEYEETEKERKKRIKEEQENEKRERRRIREEEKRRKEEEKRAREEEKRAREEERLRLEAERRRQEAEIQRLKEEKEQQFKEKLSDFRKFNFAEEMENMKNRKLTLKEVRAEIEEIIDKLEGFEDQEAKHNILSCIKFIKLPSTYEELISSLSDKYQFTFLLDQQRIEQVIEFLTRMDEAIEATIQNKENVQEILSKIFTSKSRWIRDTYKEKLMKFQQEIMLVEPAGEGLFADIKGMSGAQEQIQMLLKYESLNKDFSSILERLLSFRNDRNFLNQLKEMINQMKSQVRQTSLETENQEDFPLKRPTRIMFSSQVSISYQEKQEIIKEQIEHMQELTPKETVKHHKPIKLPNFSELKVNEEEYIQKLRKLKKKDPSKFGEVIQNSNQIRSSRNILKEKQKDYRTDKGVISHQLIQTKDTFN